MHKARKALPWILFFLLISPLAYLLVTTMTSGLFGTWKDSQPFIVAEMTQVTATEETPVTLPLDFDHQDTVVLTAQLHNMDSQRLYVKSVYSPFQVYINDQLYYDYGQKDTLPTFLQDPPVKVTMLELPDVEDISLRLEYTHPTTRADMTIEPPVVGTYPSIFIYALDQNHNYFLLHIIFLGLVPIILCIGLFIRTLERKGITLVWMALIILACSLWALGEHDVTGIFIHNETLLYLLGFAGIFYLPVAIHMFFRSTIGYHDPMPITLCALLCLFLAVVATILQATGAVSFFCFLPYLQVYAIGSFAFGTFYTAYEWKTHHNKLAKYFLVPWAVVLLSSLLESIGFLFGISSVQSSFTQLGLLVFLIVSGVIGSVEMLNSLALRKENQKMEQAYRLMELRVAEQQQYHNLLMETREVLRQQRHDLRHQLAVVQGLAQEEQWDKLLQHVDAVSSEIPEELQMHCENMAVNAVVSYYAMKAKSQNIALSLQLSIPEASANISDNNLCVIFGNIMENAIEACDRMTSGEKFLHLTCHIQNKMLVISQENSFDGHIHHRGGKFFSAKRDQLGIGLSSVQSVAQKHGGDATFTPQSTTFRSEIYVAL